MSRICIQTMNGAHFAQVKTYRCSATGEFQVEITGAPNATYFTDDRKDALGTAKVMFAEHELQVGRAVRTEALLAAFKGQPHEFEMLKGVLCMTHKQTRFDESIINQTFDTAPIAKRMDEINQAVLADFRAEINQAVLADFRAEIATLKASAL